MKCVKCGQGQTRMDVVTVRLQNHQRQVAIEQVPAEICDRCGEFYVSHAVAQQVLHQARHDPNTVQVYGLEIVCPPIEPILQVG
jgi:YgiT-type zinc finger domain-containing protein